MLIQFLNNSKTSGEDEISKINKIEEREHSNKWDQGVFANISKVLANIINVCAKILKVLIKIL